jgi:hypothetical protein
MATKERNQNIVVGDVVNLRIFSLNSNSYTNLQSIEQVNIYYLDPTAKSDINPDGRTLFTTIVPPNIIQDDTGKYSIQITVSTPQFVIGEYIDQWTIIYDGTSNCPATVENRFKIYPNLWVVADKPLIYDFEFKFTPNRITSGSIKYITANIKPIVPNGTTLEKYYESVAATSSMTISIIQRCGKCIPQEEDLRTIVDAAAMTFTSGSSAYYLLDTTDMACGIYDVFFTLNFGDTIQRSNRGQLEIYN